ncbi:caspase family protein [Methylobacterium komagatae]
MAEKLASLLFWVGFGCLAAGGGLVTEPGMVRAAESNTCILADPVAIAPAVTLESVTPNTNARPALRLRWKLPRLLPSRCRTPYYLVVAVPDATRMAGTGFLALPPQTRAPFDLGLWIDRTRILVPLHLHVLNEGAIEIHPAPAGEFALEWRTIELQSSTAVPRKQSDLLSGRWSEHPEGRGAAKRAVPAGPPRIHVEDHFAGRPSGRVVLSPDRRTELQDFGSFYRIVDRVTFDIVTERSGVEAAFSPTGRFVYAFGGAGQANQVDRTRFELFDLATNTVAISRARDDETTYSGLNWIQTLRFGERDSFLMLGFSRGGGVETYHTLIDRPPIFTSLGPNCCGAANSARIDLDVDNTLLTYTYKQDAEADEEKLVQSLAFTNQELFAALAPEHARKADEAREKLKVIEAAARADADRTPEQTHLTNLIDEAESAAEGIAARAINGRHRVLVETDARAVRYAALEKFDTGGTTEPGRRPFDRRVEFASRGARDFDRPGSVAPSRFRGDRFAQRLSDWRIELLEPSSPPARLKASAPGANGTRSTSWFMPHLREKLPEAIPVLYNDYYAGCFFSRENGRWTTQPVDDKPVRNELEPKSLGTESIVSVTAWNSATLKAWLFSTSCSYGTADDRHGQLVLIQKRPGEQPRLTWLSIAELGGVLVGDALDLGNTPTLLADVYNDKFLVVASDRSNAVVVFDMLNGLVTDIVPASRTRGVLRSAYLTKDGKVIRLGQDGSIDIFRRKPSPRRLVEGRYVDDELILFDDAGQYDGTPEAGRYAYLNFPGLRSVVPLSQYRTTLHRPDRIRSLLADADTRAAKLDLMPPPSLDLSEFNRGPEGDAVKVVAQSALGLRTIQILADGYPMLEMRAEGQRYERTLKLPKIAARWLTAVAVDTVGTESLPFSLPLRPEVGDEKPRLIVVSAGTNTYDDKRIGNLQGAEADAAGFTDLASRSTYYGSVDASRLLVGRAELRSELPKALRDATAAARPGDTLMLFVAGHGVTQDGRLFLATKGTSKDRISATALAWKDVAEVLRASRARTIVFLDVCHAGAAADANDLAANSLLESGLPLTIVSASKGRQLSFEEPKGGFFTSAIKRIVGSERRAADTNQNGVIELSELYRSLKPEIDRRTDGRQTPWIARSGVVGEAPLF